MTSPITGSCLCKQVTYQMNTTPIMMGFCHCHSCQKETGSSYLPWMVVPEDTLTVHGEIKWYQSQGASGKPISRGFCPNCGSTLLGKPDVLEGLCSVAASSLDDASIFKPQMHIWMEDAQPWACIDSTLMQFAQNPTE